MNTIETVICHHGIKGQKWGVRRYQNQDGSLTELGRRRYTKGDMHINKGTSLYRISTSKENEEDRNYKYVSLLERDRDYYKGMYSQDFLYSAWKKANKNKPMDAFRSEAIKELVKDFPVYEIEYKTTKELVSPSKQSRIKAFQRLINADPDAVKRVREHIIKDDWYTKTEKEKKEVKELLDEKKYEVLSDVVKNERAFQLFSASLNNVQEIRNKYFDILKENGYNILIDDNDAGSISKKPLILINPSDVVQKVIAKELIAKDIVDAFNRTTDVWDKEGVHVNKLDESEWK